MRGLLLALALLALAVAAGAEAEPNAHRTHGDCTRISDAGSLMGPSVVAVHVDDDRIYAARQDGIVEAVDRASGNVVWTYPDDYVPAEPIRDMVADDRRVYVAYADTENNAADQIIAIDIATGDDVWRSIAWGNGMDAFRLTQDDDFLYAGLNGGSIAKLYKHNGEAFELAGGSIVMFTPTLHGGTPDPNGIYAIQAVGDRIIAARNFGNATADSAVDLSHGNNTIIIVNKHSMQPFSGVGLEPGEAPGEYILRDGDGPREWGVFGIYADGGTQEVYLSASEWAFWFTDPSGTNVFGDRVRFGKIPLSDGGATLLADATTSIGQDPLSPPIISGTQLAGTPGASGQLVVATTTTTQTAGGFVLRIDKGDLGAQTLTTVGNGDVRAVALDPRDSDVVVHGHQCVSSAGRQAGLAMESAPDTPGMVVALRPTGGEANQGILAADLRVAASGLDDPRVEFLVSSVGGRCDDGASCYKTLASLGGTPALAIEARDAQIRLTGIDVPLPEGDDYRMKVRLLDGAQVVYEDFAEGTFTIDRTSPQILGVAPASGSTIAQRQPRLDVIVRDQWSTVAEGGTSIVVNGESLQGLAFDANGFSLDLADTGVRLREGYNDLAVVVTDRAGNAATLEAWEIRVDASVTPPVFLPQSGTWVRDERPTLTAQFLESVTLVQATLNGADVTDSVAVPPTASGEGTQLIFRPGGVLSTGLVHRFDITVRDLAGNEAGPFSRVFRVDATAPTIGQVNPTPHQVLSDPSPAIVFQPADSGSGLDVSSLGVFLDGEDITEDVRRLADRFVYLPEPLSHGKHTVTASVLDQAGNRATRTWSFQVDTKTPQVDVEVQLPPGRDVVHRDGADVFPVKRGDELTFRVLVADDGQVRAVRMDATGLDRNATTAQTLAPVPGLPGAYEKAVRVDQVRTMRVTVTVTAEDGTGQIGFATQEILVDNLPPRTEMVELPAVVGASFDLRWKNEPDDERVGGAGVAYYIVERRIDDGEWRVVLPRVEAQRVEMELLDTPFARLQFRVRAVDHAGNEQLSPSNVVETTARGDPFVATRFPPVISIGHEVTYTAQPLDEVRLDGSQVFMRFSAADGGTQDIALGRFGRLYTADWNATSLQPGTYNLQFIFRDESGIELKGPSFTVQAVPRDAGEVLAAAGGDDQGVPMPAWVAIALPAAAMLVRRRGVE